MANILGSDNNDNLIGTTGNDTIQGLGGNDSLSGGGGDDSLEGGSGSDTLTGGAGNDQFVLEYFNGSSFTQNQDLVTDFVKGQDKIDVRKIGISDYNTILALLKDDPDANALITVRYNLNDGNYYYQLKLNGISQSQLQASDFNFNTAVVNDTLSGTNDNDDLFGGLGNDTLQGNAGNDRLFGEQGDDRLFGGYGSDTLYGGAGNDQFVLEYFSGSSFTQNQDVVTDFVKGQDKIDVRNIGISDYNTILTLLKDDPDGNALITVRYNLDSGNYYYQLKLNGISQSQLQASDFNFNAAVVNDTLSGTNNNDDLFGGLGNDTLQGNAGNDRLFGEQGDDRLFGGYGSDTLYGGAGNDQFVLEYFSGSSFTQNQDVVTDFVKGQDKIDLRNIGISDYNTILTLLKDDPDGNALITVRYNLNDGNYYYQLKLNGISQSQLQASDFNFNTAVVNDTLSGTNDNDDLFGGLGNDTLQGNAGNDRLFGEQGDDRLFGGYGSDTLYGGAGNDQFVLEYFSGSSFTQNQDVVTDFVKGQDKIDLRNIGISDYNTILTLLKDDPDGNALITVRYNLNDGNYYYQLKLNGISQSQLQASDFNFNTAVVDDTKSGTNDNDDLFGGLGNDTLQGNDGNDRLFGEQGDDRLFGGYNSDTLYGGAGNDQFVLEYFSGSSFTQNQDVVTDFVKGQDKIDLRNIGISDYNTILTLTSNDSAGNALITTRYNLNDGNYYYQLKLNGISQSQLQASDFNFNAAVVNDTKSGTNNNDDLFGGLGNDTLQGNAGDDRLFGEQGDDRLLGGTGNDTLYGGADNDIAVYLGNRSQYQITNNGGVYTVSDTVANRDGRDNLYNIERIQFSDQTITLDVPPSITLALSPSSVLEDGATNLLYTFTRTGSTTNTLTVNYNVAGSAVFNTDYTQTGAASFTATTGTITFAAGASTAVLSIDPTADTTIEGNETLGITVATGSGYIVSTTSAVTGTITNDDTSAITINLSNNQTIVEGLTSPQQATYTVSLSQASTQAITVQYATTNGTAIAGSDYTSANGTLTFNSGETSKVINIPILNNSTNEANETFTLRLSSPTNAILGTTSSVITTITDTLSAAVTTTLPINVENLTLTGTAAIDGTGNAGDNILQGNSANNTLTGGAGNDTYAFVANSVLGIDRIVETATGNTDTIDFSGTTVGVRLNLGVTTQQTVNANLKLILSGNNVIENARGSSLSDRLTGNSLNNYLIGDSGNDQLQGLAGNDTLWGGLGNDILAGGAGQDKYLFQGSGAFTSALGVDYITNFDAGQDLIVLSKATFTAITNSAGQALTDFAVVNDDEFVNGSNASIVFSQGSGSLFYNQDRSLLGANKVFEFASLGNADITLTGSNFSLVP